MAKAEAEREKYHRRFEEVRHLLSPAQESERFEMEISRTTDVKKLNELRAEITWAKSDAAKSARHQAGILVKHAFIPYASAVGELLRAGLDATEGVEQQAQEAEEALFSHFGLSRAPTQVSMLVDRLKSRLHEMRETFDLRMGRSHLVPFKSEFDWLLDFFRPAGPAA